jgi:hypothetical protein
MPDFKIENGEKDFMYFASRVMKDVVGNTFLFNDFYVENI